MINPAPLFNSDRALTRQVQALATECVASSSSLLVTGCPGSGKTHLGRVLERRYQRSLTGKPGDGFSYKPFRYVCTTTTRREALFRDMIDELTGAQEGRRSSSPNLAKALAAALSASEISLLFVDNAHCLSEEDREDLSEVARRIREERPFGVIMTVYEDQLEFNDFLKSPVALLEVELRQLTVSESLHGFHAHDPRFKPWLDRFEAKNRDAEVAELAEQLFNITKGNFERLASFCRSLKHHVADETLKVEHIDLVMRRREGRMLFPARDLYARLTISAQSCRKIGCQTRRKIRAQAQHLF
jgi:hypothetical protein